MKLVILDAYAENPGDLSWNWLENLVDEHVIYDITPPDKVIERSDVISLHCPLTPETTGIVNSDFLSKMKKSAFLINTSQ